MVFSSIIPVTVAGGDLTSLTNNSTVYEEGGEFVTTIRNKILVPSLQNLTRVQAEPTGGNIRLSKYKYNNCLLLYKLGRR